MKTKLLKRMGMVLGGVVAVVAGLALYVEVDGIPRVAHQTPDVHVAAVTKERLERGTQLAGLICAECHADAATGKLTGRAMVDLPPEFGVIVSGNITRHPEKGIGGWSDGDLRYFLRTGVRPDGQYVPPYMVKLPHMSDEDLDSIIVFLRSDDPRVASAAVDPPGHTKPSFLVKALAHGPFGPLPYPNEPVATPARTDKVAYGRYMAFNLDCFSCHSADFTKVDAMDPPKSTGYFGGGNPLKDQNGATVLSANLTPDETTGIGKWSEEDFIRAVKKGFRPDGRVLHSPMMPRPELGDDEVGAMYAYLRTVPKLHNEVQRPVDAPSSDSAPGKRAYQKYGCTACHGETGVGQVADLRRANDNFPTNEKLRAWLEDAPSIKPGTRMPAWKGIIKDEDYEPLMAYVRELSRQKLGREATN